jgi:hypothetical protein
MKTTLHIIITDKLRRQLQAIQPANVTFEEV